MARLVLSLLAVFVLSSTVAVTTEANPIRKVVNLLKEMQHEIQAEGEKEKELFEKFMCFCEGGEAGLKQSAAELTLRIDELTAQLKRETAEKEQITAELADHKTDRTNAKKELEEATSLRGREKAEYDAFAGDAKTNLDAMAGAIPALEKGMAGGASLLQMTNSVGAGVVKRLTQLAEAAADLGDGDRRKLTSFLQQTNEEAAPTDQIIGILKTMQDSMSANLKEADTEEAGSVKAFTDLKASKEQAVALAGEAIETKNVRQGELAVSLVQAQNELEDSQDESAEAEKFVANLAEQCKSKQAEWDERCKTRNDEVAAVSEAIGILSDDDALETFKKAIPSASLISTDVSSVSFLQRSQMSTRMLALRKAHAVVAQHHSRPMRLLLLSLNSKIRLLQRSHGSAREGGFEKIVVTIDEMVSILKKDQVEDDKQKDWCRDEFDSSDDDKKRVDGELQALSASIQEIGDKIMTLTNEIAALQAGITALDKQVAEATEQRKEEHKDATGNMAMMQAAKALVEKAKNRMAKFYTPSEASFLQVKSADSDSDAVAPPEAPETFSGEVKKNSKSGGVLAMMDQIANDLAKDGREAEYDEKNAQKEYNVFMQDSQDSRAQDAQSITDKEGSKAQLKGELDTANEKHMQSSAELNTVEQYIRQLHAQCDFMVENYDVRKEARAKESDGLNQAKAMLSGAGGAAL